VEGIAMKRGDIIVCVIAGDYGKPRPAVVVKSNHITEDDCDSVVVCPITSTITAKTFRVRIQPSSDNGLQDFSEIMIDKIVAIRRDKIRHSVGTLDANDLAQFNTCLRFVLTLD
jgi:mRNA interferase MazF